jgi:hypothetical protein
LPPGGDGAQAFAVVVEQLRGDFKVFGEALGGLREQVTAELGGLRQQMTDGFAEVHRDLGEVKVDLSGASGVAPDGLLAAEEVTPEARPARTGTPALAFGAQIVGSAPC